MYKIHGTHRVDGADDGAVLGLERQRRLLVVRRQHLQRWQQAHTELMAAFSRKGMQDACEDGCEAACGGRAGFQTS